MISKDSKLIPNQLALLYCVRSLNHAVKVDKCVAFTEQSVVGSTQNVAEEQSNIPAIDPHAEHGLTDNIHVRYITTVKN